MSSLCLEFNSDEKYGILYSFLAPKKVQNYKYTESKNTGISQITTLCDLQQVTVVNCHLILCAVVSVCENGWRCCLINRDRRTPTDYIRNGVLYVTEK